MTEKLNPSEAQRKAMIQAAIDHSGMGSIRATEVVDAQIAAANKVPEGAPVGTIARRPDGAWIGVRREDYWAYRNLVGLSHDVAELSGGPSVAESWPVIYDPTGKTIDELRAEIDRLNKNWDNGCDEEGFCPPFTVSNRAFESVVSECNGLKGALKDAYKAHPEIAPGYLGDPTAQQEPEAFNRFPGIENPTTSDYIGAAVADEQLKLVFALRDLRKERGMEIAEVAEAADVLASEISMFESGSSNPTLALVRRYAKAVGAVFTVDVRKWEDTQPQQEPEDPGPPSNAHIEFSKPARTPRVVDRLGVDEQGSRWQDRQLGEWKFDGQAWRYLELTWTRVPGGEWVEAEPSKRYGPYVEVLS
jgi:transcriptional regulator with XRE-family HTH domain